MKKHTLIFLAIVILGSALRIVLIRQNDLFVDEVYYWRVSQMNSWKNLLLITHWIKDHGILYYIWLKALSFFVHDIPTLRYSNIFLYVVSSACFYGFFKKKYGITALFGVALLSFHRYFIYLSSTLSPYNLVACLAIISVCGFYYLKDKRHVPWWIFLLAVLSTAGALYTDYSFFFMLPFYIFYLLYIISSHVGYAEKRPLLKVYSFIVILILPGIIQFMGNLHSIQDLFANRYFEHSPFSFLYSMGGILFLRVAPFFGITFMIVPIILSISSKDRRGVALTLSHICSILMIFVSQRFFFPLFAERYLWAPYFLYILSITILLHRRTVGGVLLFAFFVMSGIVNYLVPTTDTFRVPGDISYEVKYSSLLLNNKNAKAKRIIVLDVTSASDVFTHYYFGSRYPTTDKYGEAVQQLKKKISIISPRTDENGGKLKKLLTDGQRSCILYYITDKKEDILQNIIIRQLRCETVYSLENMHGYVDSFELIYSKRP